MPPKKTLLMIATLISITSFASKRDLANFSNAPKVQMANPCAEKPEFLQGERHEVVGGLAAMPKALYVGRKAEYFVEAQGETGTPIRLHTEEVFVDANAKSPHSRVVCGSAQNKVNQSFSIYGLTLIDATPEQKVGNSLWQFQAATQTGKFSVWNQKSRILSKGSNLENLLAEMGTSYRFYQVGPSKYEMLLIKESDSQNQYLSITFDAVKSSY